MTQEPGVTKTPSQTSMSSVTTSTEQQELQHTSQTTVEAANRPTTFSDQIQDLREAVTKLSNPTFLYRPLGEGDYMTLVEYLNSVEKRLRALEGKNESTSSSL